jgi:hypothetical protein
MVQNRTAMRVGSVLFWFLGGAWFLGVTGCGGEASTPDSALDAGGPDGSADASIDAGGADSTSADAGTDGGSDASLPDTGPCEPEHSICDYPSCGCAPGEGCYPVGMRTCLPAGSVEKDESCRVITDCVPGLVCANGSCRAICEADEECVGVERCELIGGPIRVCTDDCVLGSSTGCVDGYTCGLNYSGGEPFVLCFRDDDSLPGDYTPCSTLKGGICAVGLTCTRTDADPESQCRRYCPIPDDGSCPDGGTCSPGRVPVTIGDQSFGVCGRAASGR